MLDKNFKKEFEKEILYKNRDSDGILKITTKKCMDNLKLIVEKYFGPDFSFKEKMECTPDYSGDWWNILLEYKFSDKILYWHGGFKPRFSVVFRETSELSDIEKISE
jgi:hypothetical protein